MVDKNILNTTKIILVITRPAKLPLKYGSATS